MKEMHKMIVYIGAERGRLHFKMSYTTTKQSREGRIEEKDCKHSPSVLLL